MTYKEYEEGPFAKYCDISEVKDRLLIKEEDTSYDDALNNAIQEASRTVDMFLRAYTTVPLSQDECIEYQAGCATYYYYPLEIQACTADLSASIFKRRMMPNEVQLRGALQPDQLNQMDATGWFALGIRRLEQYIKSKYVIQNKSLDTTLYNIDYWQSLFDKGLITPAEFRQYIIQETIVEEKKAVYEYRKQKEISIISGKVDKDEYEVKE